MRRKRRIAIFISGRGSNMAALAASCASGVLRDLCEIVLVLSDRPDAAGLAVAKRLGLPTACLPSQGRERGLFEREVIALLEPFQVDFIVLAGFRRILSSMLIGEFRNRIINIHPADPAVYRGLDGYRHAFERRLSRTVVTVHLVDEGVDTGTVLGRCEVDLTGAETLEDVERRGLDVEHAFYSRVLASHFAAQAETPLSEE